MEKNEELAKVQAWIVKLETKLVDSDSKVMVLESQLQASQFRVKVTEDKAWVIEEWAESTVARVEAFSRSKAFKDEVVEGSMNAFKLGFTECKKKVAKAFLAPDLSRINDLEPKEEAEEEDGRREVADGEAKDKAKLVGGTLETSTISNPKEAVEDPKG